MSYVNSVGGWVSERVECGTVEYSTIMMLMNRADPDCFRR